VKFVISLIFPEKCLIEYTDVQRRVHDVRLGRALDIQSDHITQMLYIVRNRRQNLECYNPWWVGVCQTKLLTWVAATGS